jgi:hypothetical protein
MLRSKKLRPFEVRILSVIALLLLAAGAVGSAAGLYRGDWRILAASTGVAGLGALYLVAARRGKPL